MKLTFLGAGSAFTTPEYYQSNMLISAKSGKNLLIDCGTDVRFSLNDCGINNGNVAEKIDAVYISHLHADHIGGMEWLAFCTFFCKQPNRLKLFIEKSILNRIWEHS
ncbi:MAG: MBL fold metallo-hydrolase, partial [Candidatus Anammoxibacter sp.]